MKNVQEILKKYSNKNTLIFFDGEILFNNTNLKVLENTGKNTKLLFENESLTQIEIVNIFSKQLEKQVEICFEESLKANVFETIVCEKNVKFDYSLKLIVNDFGKINYFQLCKGRGKEESRINVFAEVNFEADLNFNSLNLSDSDVSNGYDIKLLKKCAKTNLKTTVFANKNVAHQNFINITHLQKQTSSNIEAFASLNDSSQVCVDAISRIDNGFSKSSANQKIKLVNLTDETKASATPQLLIKEFDVSASHSLAVGKLDEDALYYLQTRGITRHEATELLLLANVTEFLQKIEDEEKTKDIIKILKEKIG